MCNCPRIALQSTGIARHCSDRTGPWLAFIRQPNNGSVINATAGIREDRSDRRHRRRCCAGGGPGANHLQLEDDELLRAERGVLFDRPGQREGPDQPHRGDVQRASQDPVLRRRRADPRARRLRCGILRHHRDELRQFVFLDWQELRRAIFHRGAVRAQLPGVQRLVLRRRRRPALARGLRSLQSRADPVRQYRRADDRLVPQGDQDRRRFQGRQDAHPGSRRAASIANSASTHG